MITTPKIEAAIEETEELVKTHPASTQAGMSIRTFLAYLLFLRDSRAILWTSPLASPSVEALLVALAQEQEETLHVLFRMRN